MEHRMHERLPADIEARVINLSKPAQAGTCWMLDASKSGIALLTRLPIEEGDMLHIEVSGGDMYGHVVYAQVDDGLYRIGVDVEQVLVGESDLCRLVERLSREAPAEVQTDAI